MRVIFEGGSALASGFVARDAELRYVGDKGTALTSFSVKAEERMQDGQRVPVWVNCKCWRDLAQKAQTIRKGDHVLVTGLMETRSYEGRDGELRQSTELVCDYIAVTSAARVLATPPPAAPMRTDVSSFETLTDEPDDLPF